MLFPVPSSVITGESKITVTYANRLSPFLVRGVVVGVIKSLSTRCRGNVVSTGSCRSIPRLSGAGIRQASGCEMKLKSHDYCFDTAIASKARSLYPG